MFIHMNFFWLEKLGISSISKPRESPEGKRSNFGPNCCVLLKFFEDFYFTFSLNGKNKIRLTSVPFFTFFHSKNATKVLKKYSKMKINV